jgi:hypothetical protein
MDLEDECPDEDPIAESRARVIGGNVRFLIWRKGMKPLLAVPVLNQHFDLPLGIFEDFETALGEANPLFEDLQRFIERQIALFQFSNNGL